MFLLKDPRLLPVTTLWHSNGGRDYAPWNGRHTGVIGVEDGCAAGSNGHRAALGESAISRQGVTTALPLSTDSVHHIGHVTGAILRPDGWREIVDIHLVGDELSLIERSGAKITLPFRSGFFRQPV